MLTSATYEAIIKGLFRAWFREHGVDSKIPDLVQLPADERMVAKKRCDEIYRQARQEWIDGF